MWLLTTGPAFFLFRPPGVSDEDEEPHGKVAKKEYSSEVTVKIRKTIAFVLVMGAMIAGTVEAQKPRTFDEAKELSIRQNKPLLLEFFREG